ncbi:hypothetical protein BLNAU_7585 [Blattamonas nauphoetae]|uniref:Uncharacterized protein n=1 Tax=Blattamonas nauphoetae TaxID=2049346 RepID=A0ABQ9Y181_9EUKA|nr:hypothetical protein BLNAU_7585 [Blattamonas nauphoetae]
MEPTTGAGGSFFIGRPFLSMIALPSLAPLCPPFFRSICSSLGIPREGMDARLCRDYNVPVNRIVTLGLVKKKVMKRAVRSLKEGRKGGIRGRPFLLNDDERTEKQQRINHDKTRRIFHNQRSIRTLCTDTIRKRAADAPKPSLCSS